MGKKPNIVNTVSELGTPHGILLAAAIAMGGSESLADHYENKGQRELENSRELPTKIGHSKTDYASVYSKMGIKVIKEKQGDDMFCEAVMPPGWKVQRTEHSMWSNLLDDKGRRRAQIFYKASPWDRDAFLSLDRRFNIDFHKYLPEEDKYLPEEIVMVDEPIEDERFDRYMSDENRYMEMLGHDMRIVRHNKGLVRKVPTKVIKRKYENIYEETMVTPYWVEVKDHDGSVLFHTEKQYFKTPYPVLHKEGQHNLWSEEERAAHYEWWENHRKFEELQYILGKLWLDQHYPNWADHHAYWNI